MAFSRRAWNAFGKEDQNRASCPSLGGEEGEAGPVEKTSSAWLLKPVGAGGRRCMTHAGGGFVACSCVTSGECSCVRQVWMMLVHDFEELTWASQKL